MLVTQNLYLKFCLTEITGEPFEISYPVDHNKHSTNLL